MEEAELRLLLAYWTEISPFCNTVLISRGRGGLQRTCYRLINIVYTSATFKAMEFFIE